MGLTAKVHYSGLDSKSDGISSAGGALDHRTNLAQPFLNLLSNLLLIKFRSVDLEIRQSTQFFKLCFDRMTFGMVKLVRLAGIQPTPPYL